jgi:hypothetical protein
MFESSPSRRMHMRRHCDRALATATRTKRAPLPVRVPITKD